MGIFVTETKEVVESKALLGSGFQNHVIELTVEFTRKPTWLGRRFGYQEDRYRQAYRGVGRVFIDWFSHPEGYEVRNLADPIYPLLDKAGRAAMYRAKWGLDKDSVEEPVS